MGPQAGEKMNPRRRARRAMAYPRLRLAASASMLAVASVACRLRAGAAFSMTPAEWPLRLVPRRSPPFWKALAISAAAFAGAIAARALSSPSSALRRVAETKTLKPPERP